VLLQVEEGDTTSFNYDFDDAPGIWINHDKGGQTDALTRNLEHHFASLQGFDPITGETTAAAQRLADQAEQRFLHMVTSDPNRTPNFIMFADSDFFFTNSAPAPKTCTLAPLTSCFAETRNFAWNHGNFQEDIVRTWLGIVGPGVRHEGVTNALFTDHTDVRPTVLSLAGLKDDYAHDGRVLFEILNDHELPRTLRDQQGLLHRLAAAYKAINAPVGPLGLATLRFSTQAVAGSDSRYVRADELLGDLTVVRNRIAGEMISMLEGAAFNNERVDAERAERLIREANELLSLAR
jgi:hypothetical protein